MSRLSKWLRDGSLAEKAGARFRPEKRSADARASGTAPAGTAGARPGISVRRSADIVGCLCALGYLAMALLARGPGEPGLSPFFLLTAWSGLLALGLYLHVRRRGEEFPVGRLFFWAVVFRLCGLAGGPFFEDDFYRYLWDGYRFATAGTPYGVSPEAFFLDSGVPATFRSVLDRINNPELPTIYAPTAQLVFLLGYWLSPGSVTALQVILISVDIAAIALLLRLAPAGNVMLYAWCPLVVKEIAFTAHPDGVGVCFLLAALVLAGNRRWRGAAVCLGVAAGAKVFALVLAPLVLLRARTRYWLLSALTLAALYAPFLLSGGTDMESLRVFARDWEFNSALFGVFGTVLGPFETKVALGSVFAVFWIFYGMRYRKAASSDSVPRGDWLYGALLLLSPVINPWYLLWLLPFAAVFPSIWAWTASLAVMMSYVTGLNMNEYGMQPYQQPIWARPLEFGLIALALCCDLLLRGRPGPHVVRRLRRRSGRASEAA